MKRATSRTGEGAVVTGVSAGGAWRSPFGPAQTGLGSGHVCVLLRPDAGTL